MERRLTLLAVWLFLQPLAIFAAFVVFLDGPLWWLLVGLAFGTSGGATVSFIAWKRSQSNVDETPTGPGPTANARSGRFPRELRGGIIEAVLGGAAIGIFFSVWGDAGLVGWLVLTPAVVVCSVVVAVVWYIGRGSMS